MATSNDSGGAEQEQTRDGSWNTVIPSRSERSAVLEFMLIAIKLAHTAIWALLAGAILLLPVLVFRRRFQWALAITLIILFECGILALNAARCPLTDLAARYTSDRAPNFDIYLPVWLAANNKTIFGGLFLAGEILLLFCWLRHRQSRAR